MSEENVKFQKELKHALHDNKKEILKGMAEMLGMSNEFDLRQQVIDANNEEEVVVIVPDSNNNHIARNTYRQSRTIKGCPI